MAAWDLNLLLWTLLPAVWLWTGGHGATETKLPYPWLKENRSAKVITLECRPPSQTSDWTKVHSLELSAFRPGQDMANNLTLALMTTTRGTPLKKNIEDIAQVNFTGSWDDPKTTVLTVVTPISSKDYGRYYCKGEYSNKGGYTLSFTTEVVVNDTLFSGHIPPDPVKTVNNFRVSQKAAHEVTVTWRIPDAEDFVEATVSRTRGVAAKEEDWTAIEATRSLFTKSRADDMVYTSEVILHRFHCQEAANCSITLYVDAEKCTPDCRYSCLVPYQACTGSQRQHCLCNQEGMTSLSESAGDGFKTRFFIMLGLFLFVLVCLVILVVLLCLYRAGKCSECLWVKKIFTPKQKQHQARKAGYKPVPQNTPKSKEESANTPPAGQPMTGSSHNDSEVGHGATGKVNVDPTKVKSAGQLGEPRQPTEQSPHEERATPGDTDGAVGKAVVEIHPKKYVQDELRDRGGSCEASGNGTGHASGGYPYSGGTISSPNEDSGNGTGHVSGGYPYSRGTISTPNEDSGNRTGGGHTDSGGALSTPPRASGNGTGHVSRGAEPDTIDDNDPFASLSGVADLVQPRSQNSSSVPIQDEDQSHGVHNMGP